MAKLKQPIVSSGVAQAKQSYWKRLAINYKKQKAVYWMVLPVVLYYLVFMYGPMFGQIIAFQNYRPARGIWGSEWVGLENFIDFFTGIYAFRTIFNTIRLSFLEILCCFPAPIIFALMLNEISHKHFKSVTQTISYMPHFISLVVTCGIVSDFVKSTGVITTVLTYFGLESQNLLGNPISYLVVYITSNIWQNIGWGSIIYLASLAGVDQTLYEAASIDGAGRFKKIIHITLPSLIPIISIQLIMRIGQIMSLGAEKAILLYSPAVYETADTIATYVYRTGIQEQSYSLATAVGMFNSVINLSLVFFANWFSRKYVKESLW